MTVAAGLAAFFKYAAGDVKAHNTPDPANVSKPIKLKIEREVMVGRLESARDLLQSALDNDSDETAVRTALADLYWRHLDPPANAESKAALANQLREGNAGLRMGSALAIGAGIGAALKTGSAYGNGAY